MSAIIHLALLIFVLNQLLAPCAAFRGYGTRTSNKNQETGYKNPSKPKTLGGTTSGLPSQNPTRRGLGISAWGIVSVIVAIILAGMGFYYFALCYPIMCQKQNRYATIIELPSVTV